MRSEKPIDAVFMGPAIFISTAVLVGPMFAFQECMSGLVSGEKIRRLVNV